MLACPCARRVTRRVGFTRRWLPIEVYCGAPSTTGLRHAPVAQRLKTALYGAGPEFSTQKGPGHPGHHRHATEALRPATCSAGLTTQLSRSFATSFNRPKIFQPWQ